MSAHDFRSSLIRMDREHSTLRRRFAQHLEDSPDDNAGFRGADDKGDGGSSGKGGIVVVNVNVQADPDAEAPKVLINPEIENEVEIEAESEDDEEKADPTEPTLREHLIRLLKRNPVLRPHLLPLLKETMKEPLTAGPVVPVQTREAFENEVLPEIKRLSEKFDKQQVHSYFTKVFAEALTSRGDWYKLLKHYQNGDQTDADYFTALQAVLDEWANGNSDD